MENIFTPIKITGAGIALIIGSFCGGYDVMLKMLIFLVVADFASGMIKAIFNKDLNSATFYRGGVKKMGIFLLVAFSVKLDDMLGSTVFRTATIGYYIANEGISFLENWGQIGLPLPPKLIEVLTNLKEKYDKAGEEK